MRDHPLLKDLMQNENLTEAQAAGALGLVLTQLRKMLPVDQFALIQKSIPGCDQLIAIAPEVKASFLGGLANSLGGDKAKALLEINKGLTKLNIPTNRQRELAETLKSSVSKHYPDLIALIDL